MGRDDKHIIRKWCNKFAHGEPMIGNHLWHYFSFNNNKHPLATVLFIDRYDSERDHVYIMKCNCFGRERYISHTGFTASDILSYQGDIVVVSQQWTWTYIQTHEQHLGPYFTEVELL